MFTCLHKLIPIRVYSTLLTVLNSCPRTTSAVSGQTTPQSNNNRRIIFSPTWKQTGKKDEVGFFSVVNLTWCAGKSCHFMVNVRKQFYCKRVSQSCFLGPEEETSSQQAPESTGPYRWSTEQQPQCWAHRMMKNEASLTYITIHRDQLNRKYYRACVVPVW